MNRLIPALTEAVLALPRDDRVYLAQRLLEGLLPYPEGVASVSPGLRRGTRRYPGSPPIALIPQRGFGPLVLPSAWSELKPLWGLDSKSSAPRVGEAPTLGFGTQALWA